MKKYWLSENRISYQIFRGTAERQETPKGGLDGNYREDTKKTKRVTNSTINFYCSFGGRIVLINFVLSAIPLYQSSIYRVLVWARKKIDKLHRELM